MEAVPVKIVPRGYGETERQDAWWIEADSRRRRVLVVPRLRHVGGDAERSISSSGRISRPSIRRCCSATSHHAWFGPRPDWFPLALFYPALLILPFPGLFRFTCYYYRGAYYKAFWQDPVSCAVGEPRGTSYWGERWFPLVLQNVHRYFAYAGGDLHRHPVVRRLAGDCGGRTRRPAQTEFGIGVGTLVMLVNVLLIASYTFGCHSLRHLFGGRRDEVSKAPISEACYHCSSALNGRHMLFAWLSLFSVGLTDAYIRLCSMGVLTDFRIL